ncbi:MAG: hypothetical protein M3R14_01300 [Acidobacteriota bacterium]|nr:hypothetical protein [Acidobacteriota bacterium]
MPKKTKPKKDSRKHSEKEAKEVAPERRETDEQGNWSKDQQEKNYYYDDSYGYEVYVPDEEGEENER